MNDDNAQIVPILKAIQFLDGFPDEWQQGEPDEPPWPELVGRRGVTGSIPGQGLVILLGPNSAGKSTVLELLAWALGPPPDLHEFNDHDWLRLVVDDPYFNDRFKRAASFNRTAEEWHVADALSALNTKGEQVLLASEGKVYTPQTRKGPGLAMGESEAAMRRMGLPRLVVCPLAGENPDVVLREEVDDLLATKARLWGSSRSADGRWVHGLQRPAPDLWVERDRDGNLGLGPAVQELCDQFEEALNEAPPEFLRRHGRLFINPLPVERWLDGGTRLELSFVNFSEGPRGPVRAIGRGAQRWVSILIRVAAAQLHRQMLLDTDTFGGNFLSRFYSSEGPAEAARLTAGASRLILAIDEPEAHLHPTAQRSVANWLADVSRTETVIVATHAGAFLKVDADEISYGLIRPRWHQGPWSASIEIQDVTRDLLAYARDHPNDLGLDSVGWIAALRALVFVEGEHDQRVLQQYFGSTLQELRVEVLPMHGGSRWKSLAESDLARTLGIPLLFVFDNVRAEALKDVAIEQLADEERWARDLLAKRADGEQVDLVRYDDPDILCAIPPSVLGRVFPDRRGALKPLSGPADDWTPAITMFRAAQVPNFKRWLLNGQLAFSKPAIQVIDRLIGALDPRDLPTQSATRMMQGLQARVLGTHVSDQ